MANNGIYGIPPALTSVSKMRRELTETISKAVLAAELAILDDLISSQPDNQFLKDYKEMHVTKELMKNEYHQSNL